MGAGDTTSVRDAAALLMVAVQRNNCLANTASTSAVMQQLLAISRDIHGQHCSIVHEPNNNRTV
jgi:hypothetical protein